MLIMASEYASRYTSHTMGRGFCAYYYFTHKDGNHTLVLADAYSSRTPFPGYATATYYCAAGRLRRRVRCASRTSSWISCVSRLVAPRFGNLDRRAGTSSAGGRGACNLRTGFVETHEEAQV